MIGREERDNPLKKMNIGASQSFDHPIPPRCVRLWSSCGGSLGPWAGGGGAPRPAAAPPPPAPAFPERTDVPGLISQPRARASHASHIRVLQPTHPPRQPWPAVRSARPPATIAATPSDRERAPEPEASGTGSAGYEGTGRAHPLHGARPGRGTLNLFHPCARPPGERQ